MEDSRLVELFFARSEEAIAKTDEKYRTYCHSIAKNILGNDADAQECVNDVYLAAWNKIPPSRPQKLSVFLGKITRRIAIDQVRERNAQKRGGGELPLALDELEECLEGGTRADEAFDRKELTRAITAFIKNLPETKQKVFLRRYFYLDSVDAIAERFSFSVSRVKSMLKRTRDKLKNHLQKEDLL